VNGNQNQARCFPFFYCHYNFFCLARELDSVRERNTGKKCRRWKIYIPREAMVTRSARSIFLILDYLPSRPR
jgi:hypothetical protein